MPTDSNSNRKRQYNYCGLQLVDYIDRDTSQLTDDDKTYTLFKTQDKNNSRRSHKFKIPWLGKYKVIYYEDFHLEDLIYTVAGWL